MAKNYTKLILSIFLLLTTIQITGCRQTPAPDQSENENTSGGGGDESDELLAPSNVNVTVISTTELKVTWTNPDYTDLASILLQYKKTADSTYTDVDVATATEKNLTGLVANTAYDIRLKAIGDQAEESEFSNVVNATTTVASSGPCPKAYNVFGVRQGTNHVHLTWGWDNNNFSGLTSYHVQRELSSESTFNSTIQSFNNSGTPGTVYDDINSGASAVHYRIVSVCDGIGYSSNPGNKVPMAAPTNFTASNLTANNHQLLWEYPTPNPTGLIGFKVRLSVNNGSYIYVDYNSPNSRSAVTNPSACGGSTNTYTVSYEIKSRNTDPTMDSAYTQASPFPLDCQP